MKIVQFSRGLSEKVYSSVKRFPLALLYASFVAILAIITNHMGYDLDEVKEKLARLGMSAALGVPISLCIYLIFEIKPNIKKIYKRLSHIGTLIIVALMYYILLQQIEFVSGVRYASYTLALYLTFTFIPYLNKRENYEIYLIKLFTRFIVTYVYSLILYLGLAAILLTINLLFEVRIPGEIFADIAIIVAGIFAPAFFLADVPKIDEEMTEANYPKVLKVLLQFIILPLLSAYTIILYAYFIKIFIAMELPEGIIGNLVLWYSIISTIVLFLIYKLRKSNGWVNLFLKIFPKAIIPLLAMMLFSIFIRIRHYGFTEPRYFVTVIGLWVTFVMIYYSIKKDIKNIILPITLVAIIIISVTGFVDAFSVSKWSQNNRFEEILIRYNMISDNLEIIPLSEGDEIEREDQNEINNIIEYFNRNHNIDDIKYLPREFKLKDMLEIFGFEFQRRYMREWQEREYFNIQLPEENFSLDISEYEYFNEYSYWSHKNQSRKLGEHYTIIYDPRTDNNFKITQNERIVYTKNIIEFLKEMDIQENKEYLVSDLTFIDENEEVRIKIVFKNIRGYSNKFNDELIINGADFYVFLKIIS